MQSTYRLHILRHRGSQDGIPPTYTLALANSPRYTGEGGAMPTVHHPSWKSLSQALLTVGCEQYELASAKEALDARGNYTFTEVHLDAANLRTLGYVNL